MPSKKPLSEGRPKLLRRIPTKMPGGYTDDLESSAYDDVELDDLNRDTHATPSDGTHTPMMHSTDGQPEALLDDNSDSNSDSDSDSETSEDATPFADLEHGVDPSAKPSHKRQVDAESFPDIVLDPIGIEVDHICLKRDRSRPASVHSRMSLAISDQSIQA